MAVVVVAVVVVAVVVVVMPGFVSVLSAMARFKGLKA